MNSFRRAGMPRFLVLAFALVGVGVPLFVVAKQQFSDAGQGYFEIVWGEHGVREGMFHRPRAIATRDGSELYVVDKSARIQVFDPEGNYLRGWRTPVWENGKPTGLTFHPDGSLMVADTHYFRILFYSPAGDLLEDRTLGGEFGTEPGQFGLVTDAVADSKGCIYVSEYGEYDRIQKFSPDGKFLFQWGGGGNQPGQFARPQNMTIDEQDRIWVVDACNDRIQVFDATGEQAEVVQVIGRRGEQLGEFRYPYDILLTEDFVYVCEFGNHRVQKLTRTGEPIGSWGTVGKGPGQLYNPWAIVRDERGRIHVVDTYNHRVQRIQF